MIHIHRLMILSHGATPYEFPLLIPLDNSPFPRVPPTYLESLLFVWCDPRPPWSQVARKLTSPSPFPPHSIFPPSNGSPNVIVRPFKMTSPHRLHIVRNSKDLNFLVCDNASGFQALHLLLAAFPISCPLSSFLFPPASPLTNLSLLTLSLLMLFL
jgi:hypothetical protein